VWNGSIGDNKTAPDGVYQMVVTAKDVNGTTITPTITTRETINGVDFSGSSPQIITASGAHSLSEVRAIATAN
jgi:flagellar hook assembly protein FlgD